MQGTIARLFLLGAVTLIPEDFPELHRAFLVEHPRACYLEEAPVTPIWAPGVHQRHVVVIVSDVCDHMTCPADIDDIVVINVVIVADECDLLTFLAFVGKTVARAQQSLDVLPA